MDSRIIGLIQRYLFEHGYNQSLFMFQEESQVMHDFEDEEGGAHERLEHLLSEHDRMMDARAVSENLYKEEDQELLSKSEILYPRETKKLISNVHILNPLTVRIAPNKSNIIVTGGADKTVKITDIESGENIETFTHHNAGVLTLEFHPVKHNILLTGSMDGTHAIIDVNKKDTNQLLASWSIHKKYVVRVKWSPNGYYFATCSYDRSLTIYSFDEENPQNSKFLKKFDFTGTVESIIFSPDSQYLVASVRDDNYLHYIHFPDLVKTRHNLNSNGDDFVSFTAMDLQFAPSGKYISVLTDKNRLIILRINSNSQVANIYDIKTDPLGQPRHFWDPQGGYIYVTEENSIAVVELASQRTVHRLQGHTNIVRDLTFGEKGNIISVSFDKSVRIWSS